MEMEARGAEAEFSGPSRGAWRRVADVLDLTFLGFVDLRPLDRLTVFVF